MKPYPVSVPWKDYRGADAKKRTKIANYNRIANKISAYLNDDLSKSPDDYVKVYYSSSVARDLNEDAEIVRAIIMSIDGGSNGVTIFKGNFERALAKMNK